MENSVRKSRPPVVQTGSAMVPEGVRLYAIGDVHGRSDLLYQLFARIDADLACRPSPRPTEIYLGDYVDRGPGSREVIDLLIARRCSRPLICLKGNHETFVSEFIRTPAMLAEWQHYGGLETLLSYGLKPSMNADERQQIELSSAFERALPELHRRFLSGLPSSFTCGDYFLVHAGVRPGIPLRQQREADLLWIREDFLFHEEPFSKVIVHGHTPVMQPEVRPNRINIDTGAYATGQLTCLVLEGDEMFFL
jgi:serine/threonine protein phosphatase 1